MYIDTILLNFIFTKYSMLKYFIVIKLTPQSTIELYNIICGTSVSFGEGDARCAFAFIFIKHLFWLAKH